MADEQNTTPEEEQELRIHDQEADTDTALEDDEPFEESHPEMGQLHQDYVLPGVAAGENDPYKWHTGEKRDHGGEDAIEVIDVVKQFGRMRILNGLNLGLPDNQISMVLGPSDTGKSVLIKHIVGLLYRTRATCSSTASRCPACPTTSCSRCARSSACSSRTARCSAR